MKVIHLLPSMESGGVEQVVLELGKGFAARGIENIVISDSGRLVPQLISDGSRHIELSIGKKRLSTLFKIAKLRHILEEEKPDVLHLHSRVPAWVGWFAWNSMPEHQRPVLVSTVHGFYSTNAYSSIMACGQRVVAVSNCIKDYILENYDRCAPENIRVIPNAINPETHYPGYTPRPEWTRGWELEYPELKGKFTLCLPGRITRVKGFMDMVPILSELIEQGIPAHAVMVGEAKKGKEAYKQEVIDAIERVGLTDHVTWVGHRSDLRDVQASCSVTLSLTLKPESFGKTTLEALAIGRPVAGYAHGGVEEQLEVFLPEGLVPVGDTQAMAQLLANWYHNPVAPKGEVASPYRLDDMIESHLAMYQELLDERKA
jgi:glycosyltransferase involved in cell wall biosynthesis